METVQIIAYSVGAAGMGAFIYGLSIMAIRGIKQWR